MTTDLDPFLDIYVKAALGRKAFDIVILDIREQTSVADLFIICSGRSNRQVSYTIPIDISYTAWYREKIRIV